jgi:hypothetical protein
MELLGLLIQVAAWICLMFGAGYVVGLAVFGVIEAMEGRRGGCSPELHATRRIVDIRDEAIRRMIEAAALDV